MTFVIGIALSGLTELISELSASIGKKWTTRITYTFLFVVALIYAYLQSTGFFTTEMFLKWWGIVASAVGTYELIIKRIAQPAFGYKK